MSELIDTTEMYLRTVFELEEEGIPPLRARIAERLHHSGPTVSQTVARMERDGLLTVTPDRHIRLSEEGHRVARNVMRKHRLVERLLIDVIGLDWDLVHAEACRWEHVVSDEVEERLVSILGDTTVSPYGNPIPGLEDLGAQRNDPPDQAAKPLGSLVGTSPANYLVQRIGESLQAEQDLLDTLHVCDIRPGSRITAQIGGLGVQIIAPNGSECELASDAAEHLYVEAA